MTQLPPSNQARERRVPFSRTRNPDRRCCGFAGSARGGTGPSRGQSSNRAAPAEAKGQPRPPNRPQSLQGMLSTRRRESLAGWTCKRSSVSPIMSKVRAVQDLFTLSSWECLIHLVHHSALSREPPTAPAQVSLAARGSPPHSRLEPPAHVHSPHAPTPNR